MCNILALQGSCIPLAIERSKTQDPGTAHLISSPPQSCLISSRLWMVTPVSGSDYDPYSVLRVYPPFTIPRHELYIHLSTLPYHLSRQCHLRELHPSAGTFLPSPENRRLLLHICLPTPAFSYHGETRACTASSLSQSPLIPQSGSHRTPPAFRASEHLRDGPERRGGDHAHVRCVMYACGSTD